MEFKKLQDLADRVAEKLEKPVCISVDYWYFSKDSKRAEYHFYTSESSGTKDFPTVQELNAHMENILNPKEDEGLDLQGEREEDDV